MKKVFLLMFVILFASCFSHNTHKENVEYEVQIYFFPRPKGKYPNGILIYNNEDKLFFSRKISEEILTAKRTWLVLHEKDYLFEGFFKIYLINDNDKLEFIVSHGQDVYDVKRKCNLDYCAALDIYRYLGAKYLKEFMDSPSTETK